MQRFLSRRPSAHTPFEMRPATLADRAALTGLTEHARRTHFHLDWWSVEDWIKESTSGAWVALNGKQIAGTLIAPLEDAPIAWVRLIAIADDYASDDILTALFSVALESLQAAGIESLACLSHPDWLIKRLPRLGFTPFIDVTHYRKDDRSIPDTDAPEVTIRPVTPGELPTVLANDRAAFDPIWWHTLASLQRILRDAADFIVAELDGRIIGHAFSDLYSGQGHLIRLAVHPAYQKRGIGARLLAEALTHLLAAGAYPLTLNTQVDNYTSQSLYRRFGFHPTGDSTTVMMRKT